MSYKNMPDQNKWRIPEPLDATYRQSTPRVIRDKHFQIAQALMHAYDNVEGRTSARQQKMMQRMKKPYTKNNAVSLFQKGADADRKRNADRVAAQENFQKRKADAEAAVARTILQKQKIVNEKKSALEKAKKELENAERNLAGAMKVNEVTVNRTRLNELNKIISGRAKLQQKLLSGNIANHLVFGNSAKAQNKRQKLTYRILEPRFHNQVRRREEARRVLNLFPHIHGKDFLLRKRNQTDPSYRYKLMLPKNNKGKYKLPVEIRNSDGKLKSFKDIRKEYKRLTNPTAMNTNNNTQRNTVEAVENRAGKRKTQQERNRENFLGRPGNVVNKGKAGGKGGGNRGEVNKGKGKKSKKNQAQGGTQAGTSDGTKVGNNTEYVINLFS
jgi:hypothetical protein